MVIESSSAALHGYIQVSPSLMHLHKAIRMDYLPPLHRIGR